MKKAIVITASTVLSIVLFIFIFYLFIIPSLINSKNIQNKITEKISEKTNYKITIKGLNYKSKFNFKNKVRFNELRLKNNQNEDVLVIKDANITLSGLKFAPVCIDINYVLFDKSKFKIKKKEEKKKKNVRPIRLKDVKIQKALVILESTKNNHSEISFDDLALKEGNINFNAKIKSNYIKDEIKSKSEGNLKLNNNKLTADNLNIYFKKAPLRLDGTLFSPKDGYSFTLKGDGINTSDIKECFLFFIKQKTPQKNFIENFYNFKGTALIDLKFQNKTITGTIALKEFSVKTVKFSVPMYFPLAVFYFEDKTIYLESKGKLGKEPLSTTFLAKNLYTEQKTIEGTLNSTVGSRFAKTYIPGAKIKGNVDLTLRYFIKDRKPQIEYMVNVKKGSDLFYQKAQPGLADKNRQLYAKTLKDGNNMYLEEYNYSSIENNKRKIILKGSGLFKKVNEKFKLIDISVQTNGYAPVYIIGSIGKYINNGYFNGKLNYNHPNNLLTGRFDLKEARIDDFYIEKAFIEADEKILKLRGQGLYNKEPYSAKLDMENNFKDDIIINNIDLYLKKYEITRKQSKTKQSKKSKTNSKRTAFNIKRGNIWLEKLSYKKIMLENLKLEGYAQDNIFYFSMPDIAFAQGKLGAIGVYDLDYHASNIDFSAEKINSNAAASMIFNLKDQFEGFANAKMNLKTYNKLDLIDAEAEFSIINGALTKIGSSEFLINSSNKDKKPIKIQLEKLINVDFKKMQALKSDIKGSFDMHNSQIENIELYNRNKFLSLFAEGNYNITSQDANLCLFAKYNKASQKGIKILFVPLSWITKIIFKNENTKHLYTKEINKIPPIEASEKEQEIIMVSLDGNINDAKNIKVKLKSLK